MSPSQAELISVASAKINKKSAMNVEKRMQST